MEGLGGYDIRYSLSPIDDTNWDSATQVTDEPVPGVTGAVQTFLVAGLAPDTQYYLAIKSYDQAEPANVSALSNIVPGTRRRRSTRWCCAGSGSPTTA